jgi:hypothetical protein
VVDHDAVVQKNEWNFQSLAPIRVKNYLLAIVFFPVILFWYIAFALACYSSGDDGC